MCRLKVMEEIVNQINPRPNDKIWLLYLTIPYKNKKDFINVRKISQKIFKVFFHSEKLLLIPLIVG